MLKLLKGSWKSELIACVSVSAQTSDMLFVVVQGEAMSEDPADDTNYCSLQNLINGKYARGCSALIRVKTSETVTCWCYIHHRMYVSAWRSVFVTQQVSHLKFKVEKQKRISVQIFPYVLWLDLATLDKAGVCVCARACSWGQHRQSDRQRGFMVHSLKAQWKKTQVKAMRVGTTIKGACLQRTQGTK